MEIKNGIVFKIIKFICCWSTIIVLLVNFSLVSNYFLIFIIFELIKCFLCDLTGLRNDVDKNKPLKKELRIIKIIGFILTTIFLLLQPKSTCPYSHCDNKDYCIKNE
jgi:hypothetical protein